MRGLQAKPVDIILLGSAGGLFVVLALWAGIRGVRSPVTPALPPPGTGSQYRPAPLGSPETKTELWKTPPGAGTPTEWLFDAFTPPVIFYDPINRAFSVTPPEVGSADEHGAVDSFGLRLVGVKRTPYRIQLVGYVGSEGDFLATFEDVETGTTFVARPGRTVEEPGMILLSFSVEKVRDDSNAGTVVQDRRATAVIRDMKLEREVTLVLKSRAMNESPKAVFQVDGESAHTVEGRQGDAFATMGGTFEVGLITLDPPSAEVSRIASDGRPTEVRRLEPIALNTPTLSATTGEDPGFQGSADPK